MKISKSKIGSILLAILILATKVYAGNFSYIYIQGDKKIPFYVKLEDEMLPRYSKNYCIIPQLAPGPVKLQILFQQNQYPAQAFTIQVPENGHRGFLLTMKDNAFALYDIEQKFYLLPGALGEDHLPEMITTPLMQKNVSINTNQDIEKPIKNSAKNKTATTQSNNEPQFIDNIELANNHGVNEQQPVPPPVSKPVTTAPPPPAIEQPIYQEQSTAPTQPINEAPQYQEQNTPQQPVNIANELAVNEQPAYQPPPQQQPVNISNEVAVNEQPVYQQQQPIETNIIKQEQPINTPPTQPEFDPVRQQAEPAIDNSLPVIINDQCPSPMGDKDFSTIYTSTKEKMGDDKRVMYMMKQAGSKCFTTRQAFLLSRELEAEAMRYSFLKKVFSHITDQQNFPMLEDALFNTLEWKSYFRLIYQP